MKTTYYQYNPCINFNGNFLKRRNDVYSSIKKDGFCLPLKSKVKNLDYKSSTGKLVEKDLLLLKKAESLQISSDELLVPEFKTLESARKNVEIGDVFSIQGEKNIFLKIDEQNSKHLKFDKKAYCKLFPPVKRFISNQRNSGDCYLISSLNKMTENPNARKYIYDCFESDEEGNITVKLPESEVSVTIKPDETIYNLGVISNRCAKGALGIQLLEFLYKKEVLNDKIKNLEHEIQTGSDFLSEFYEKNSLFFKANNVEKDDYDGIKEAVEEKISDIINKIKSEFGIELSYNKLKSLYLILYFESKNEDEISYKALSGIQNIIFAPNIDSVRGFAEKLNEYYKHTGSLILNGNFVFSSVTELKKNIEKLNEMKNNPQYFEKAGGDGGNPIDVYKKFGIKQAVQIALCEKFLNNVLISLLNNPEEQENYIITAGTRDKKLPHEYFHLPASISSNHAYGFEVVKGTDRMPLIKVTNPWDTFLSNKQKIKELTPDEFVKYFEYLYIANVKDDSLFITRNF